jgi:hypothetical protein
MPTSPLLRQLPRRGGGEDGLAEAFKDEGHAVEAFATGVYPGEQGVEFVYDALLFGKGSEGDLEAAYVPRTHGRIQGPLD